MVDLNGNPSYYQVCLNLNDKETLDREVRSLKLLKNNYPKTIITYDRFLLDDIEGIRVVNILDWLLE